MPCSRVLVAGLLFAAFVVGNGCAAESSNDDDVASSVGELAIPEVGVLGTIANEETKTGSFNGTPKHRAFSFRAKAGDDITARVASVNGNAIGYVADAANEALATNDDADPYTRDAKVTYKVPAGTPEREYRIVFRDVAKNDMSFRVKLSIRNPAAPCNPAYEPYREYKGNAVQCRNLRWECDPGEFKFTNSCGCGCETPP